MGIGNSFGVRVSGLFLLAWQAKALAPLPQAFAAYAQLLCQLGLIHLVLMLEHKFLEIVLQG